MNNYLIDRQDPRVAVLFHRMEKVNKTLDKLENDNRPTFKGRRYLTDSELSAILRISRHTLWEYRTAGVIPYYLICGKILYCEAEIRQLLEDGRKRSIEEMELL